MRIEALVGEALEMVLEDAAALRIAVFREWPYIYDGDLEYERRYLETYRQSDAAILVGAFDGDRLVGAATGTLLTDHLDGFAAAFDRTGIGLETIFYCAESVLLPEYRGRGIGHRFFDLRESHGRRLGATVSAFCSVIRPGDHPMKPVGYRPLDAFWRKRGYAPLEGAVSHFAWKDLDEEAETTKPLQVWMRSLEDVS